MFRLPFAGFQPSQRVGERSLLFGGFRPQIVDQRGQGLAARGGKAGCLGLCIDLVARRRQSELQRLLL